MADRLHVKLVGTPMGSGTALPWMNLRFEDIETGRIIPIAMDRIVLKNLDNAVVAEVSLLIHTVEIADPCMESIGDEVQMIPDDVRHRLATINGTLVCRCHTIKPEDYVREYPSNTEDVDRENQ